MPRIVSAPSARPWALAAVLALVALAARPAAAGWDTGLVICADYTGPASAGAFGRLPPWTVTRDVATLGTDPVARWHDGLVYVVNRAGGSNLQILDPADGWRTVRQFSLGGGRNPQDIAFAPDGTAWVSCYDAALLLRVDVVAGTVTGTVSTAAFADADGLPETGWMEAVGWRLYITAQRLDRTAFYAPSGPGALLVFDLATQSWIDAAPATPEVDPVWLVGGNPSGQPELAPGGLRLRLGCIGFYGLLDGGVEEVDLVTLQSRGFLVTEAALGGDLLDFTVLDAGHAWAIVSDATFATAVRGWRPDTGAAGATARASDQYAYPDLAWDGGAWLYVADRTPAAAGLRVFDAWTGVEQTGAAIACGLPPAWIALPRLPVLTAVALPGPAVAALRLAPPVPNPANPGCVIALEGPPETTVAVTVHDLRGRRVRAAPAALDRDGRGRFRFDGRDDAGRTVAAGRYVVRAGGAAVGLTIVR
ncbi:MAG: NHL repeat-containing protein [Candidatus Krumholzibacteriia bacterium]